jgi:hypothetical protein
MCALVVGWILFIFCIEEFARHRSVPGEYEHFSSKNRCPVYRPQKQNNNFIKNCLYVLEYISIIYGDQLLNPSVLQAFKFLLTSWDRGHLNLQMR